MNTKPKRPEDNPDVRELMEANRAGCDHRGVKDALTADEVAAQIADFGFVARAVAKWCDGCKEMIPCRLGT
jgi:hypothetical protein